MAWIDYKKAYDLVPHSGIVECLDLFRVAENIKSLSVNSMEKWKVMLCSSEVEIKQGIFQGDSLSPYSTCFSIDSIKFDCEKGEGSI